MKLLLYAGLLYLAGISLLILVQPSLVFREDGSWKEFGVGRDPNHYTWMPFWLFAVLWALLSYMIILMIAGANMLPGVQTLEETTSEEMIESLSPRIKKRVFASMDQEGYYMLNTEATGKGAPKYVYLGAAAPNLVYNAASSQ
jgi:hypothetical protein